MGTLSPEDECTVDPYRDSDVGGLDQRRIRHISSIQLRNLTPFPVRDAFASALAQPSEQPQFTVHGHLSDDLDVTLSRRRSRRISMNSVNTLRSLRSEEGGSAEESRGSGEPQGRKKTRVSFPGAGSLGASSGSGSAGRPIPASAAPTIRSGNRNRTGSIASTTTSPFAGTYPFSASALSTASTLPDNSQASLERVINARLVETFVTVTVPPASGVPETEYEFLQSATILGESTLLPRPLTPPHTVPHTKETFPLSHRKSASPNGSTRNSPLKSGVKSIHTPPRRESSASQHLPSSYQKSPSKPSRPNGKVLASSTSPTSRKPLTTTESPPSNHDPPSPPPKIPNYLSPIHRPSTNPFFPIDSRSGHEFAEWSDLSGDKLKVEVWGKVGLGWHGDGKGKGKEKEQTEGEWKVLEEWNFSLVDLVPLPEDLACHPSHLPSNTLLITLSPPSQVFYLPSRHAFTRAPSPSAGYNSDPESEVRKVKRARDFPLSVSAEGAASVEINARSRRRHRRGGGELLGTGRERVKTARLQDLLKIVDLQSCIIDNSQSLSEIILEIDRILEGDVVSVLKREVSGRELRLEELREGVATVRGESYKLRDQLESRREQLRQRKEMINLAKDQREYEISSQIEHEAEVEKERIRFSSLKSRFTPTRTTLLTTLSAIFPIDLLSPPDLLYAILGVPLPIPVSASDPAPPLTLAAHKGVTEDTVATALGYAAQVVQLLAAYLGKGLIYPVTCVGSRSLIRDGISAMVGPRMFPLFSKGVDTYRFEYGVFLLNKDIEMLMTDRDLRALDMRHTLPNLKNLLLTLTDGEGAHLAVARANSPMSSIGLESPPRLESPTPSEHTTKATGNSSSQATDSLIEPNTPPESGSTTPTASTDTSRKSRAFLGLYPLTGFLRSRYPSGRQLVPDASEGSNEIEDMAATGCDDIGGMNGEEENEEEEDRRTLREVAVNDEDEGKRVVREKVVDGEIPVNTASHVHVV